MEQAQLWQQLIEQPKDTAAGNSGTIPTRVLRNTSAPERYPSPGRHNPGSHPGIPTYASGPPPAPQGASLQGGVTALQKTIESLQEGETVLLLARLWAAEAGEMTPIAETLLDHLLDRKADVVMVSTLPEGQDFIRNLMTSASYAPDREHLLSSRYSSVYHGYLAGGASGIADFLNSGARTTTGPVVAYCNGTTRSSSLVAEQNAIRSAKPLPIGPAECVGKPIGDTLFGCTRQSRVACWPPRCNRLSRGPRSAS